MGYLTPRESGALAVKRMILHIVGAGQFQPQPELPAVEQEDFFLDRIRDTDASGLFVFDNLSQAKTTLEHIATGALSFEQGAQQLANSFSGQHRGTAVEGALFMFELESGDQNTKLFSIIKYDYGEIVYRQARDGAVHFRKIVEAFVADKRALQKSCLVRIVNGTASGEIAAQDRMGRAPDLTAYFAAFLGVSRDRDDEELNRALSNTLAEVFASNREVLPGRNVGGALRIAKDALSQRQTIDNAAVLEAVLIGAGNPTDDDVTGRLASSVTAKLRTNRLTSVSFAPSQAVLARAPRKRLKTVEGVTIEYPSELENVRVRTTTNAQGASTITIETARIEDESLVRDSAR